MASLALRLRVQELYKLVFHRVVEEFVRLARASIRGLLGWCSFFDKDVPRLLADKMQMVGHTSLHGTQSYSSLNPEARNPAQVPDPRPQPCTQHSTLQKALRTLI